MLNTHVNLLQVNSSYKYIFIFLFVYVLTYMHGVLQERFTYSYKDVYYSQCLLLTMSAIRITSLIFF